MVWPAVVAVVVVHPVYPKRANLTQLIAHTTPHTPHHTQGPDILTLALVASQP